MNARKRPFKSGLHLASRSFLAGIAIYVNGIESMEGQRLCEVESSKKMRFVFRLVVRLCLYWYQIGGSSASWSRFL